MRRKVNRALKQNGISQKYMSMRLKVGRDKEQVNSHPWVILTPNKGKKELSTVYGNVVILKLSKTYFTLLKRYQAILNCIGNM